MFVLLPNGRHMLFLALGCINPEASTTPFYILWGNNFCMTFCTCFRQWFSTCCSHFLRHSAFTSMAHRAYKTLHPRMMVPDGFTLETVDVVVPTSPEEPQDYTTVLIPLTLEQYTFMTTVTTEQNQVQKIPGYMRCPTLGFVGMLCSIMDCIGYISWLIHEGHDSTVDLGTFFVYKLSLQM